MLTFIVGGSSENDALPLVSTGSKTPSRSGAMCDTMEMSRCVHVFTPREIPFHSTACRRVESMELDHGLG